MVIPITKDKADLQIELGDGTLVEGQVNVADADTQGKGFKRIFYKNNISLNEHAKKAILEADFVLIGPGNYYCSVIPNLIVDGFKEALEESKAKLILPINLTNKQGQTQNWKVSDYVNDIEIYLGKKVDIILVNNEPPTVEQTENYKLEEGDGVLVVDDLVDSRIVRESLISPLLVSFDKTDDRQMYRSFIRHDSVKMADVIARIISN